MIRTLPAYIAAMTAYLTDKLPHQERNERGTNTLEMAIIIVAVIGVVALLVVAITTAVTKHTAGIK